MMTIFSFRAECPDDLEKLYEAFRGSNLIYQFYSNKPQDEEFPDVRVELETSASLEVIREIMRKVVDGHVMLQTLRECPLSENTLERDYELL